ncbi:MAG: hypothetical protein ACK42Z_07730 [Candidatus Kapaibacteriota bacterium]
MAEEKKIGVLRKVWLWYKEKRRKTKEKSKKPTDIWRDNYILD